MKGKKRMGHKGREVSVRRRYLRGLAAVFFLVTYITTIPNC